MSMRADLVCTFQNAKKSYGLTEHQCAELFFDVITDLDWGIAGGTGDDWNPAKGVAAAMDELFHKPIRMIQP